MRISARNQSLFPLAACTPHARNPNYSFPDAPGWSKFPISAGADWGAAVGGVSFTKRKTVADWWPIRHSAQPGPVSLGPSLQLVRNEWMNEPCLPGGSSAWPAWRQRREWRCGKGCYCGSPPPPDLQAKNGSNESTCVKMAEALTHWRTSRLWPDPDGSGLSVRTRETNESTASEVDVLNEWNVHWFPLFNEWMTSANHLRSTCPRRKRWTAIGWSVPVASVVSMAKWMKWMAANSLQLIYFGGSVVEVVQKGILRLKSPGGRFLFPPLVQRLEPAAAVQSTRCSHWWLNTQKQQVYHRPTRSNLTQSFKSIVRLACQGPPTSKFAKKFTNGRKILKKFTKFTHYLILKSAKFQNFTSKIVGTTR